MPIVVLDAVALDQQLKVLWQGFAGALAARDKAKAMQYFTASAGTRYGPVLDVLLSELPQIVTSFSPLLRTQLGIGYSEYAVIREIEGVRRVYLIQFVQQTDGIWRIESM